MSAAEALAREIPSFEEVIFGDRRRRYCLIVFVINEGEKIRRQIQSMGPLADLADLVLADGGSSDGSVSTELLARSGFTALLTKTGAGKLSAQMRMAFAWALDCGYDGVVIVDGNEKDDLSAVPDFVRLLDEGYDHIQGSRFIKGGRAIRTPLSRLVGVRLLHAPLISLASRTRQTDTTNGFRAYSRRLLEDPVVSIFRDVFSSYELHYHLAIEGGRLERFRMIETPVTRAYPRHGKVPTKISPVVGSVKVLGILFRAVTGRYRLQKRPGSKQ
jgi:dolichol-phosphate mannosyltransferase